MAGSLLTRALGALDFLACHAQGATLQLIADRVGMPKSGAHRLMAELIEQGYVAQDSDSGRYVLTLKLSSLGFKHLAASGMVDVAQPLLNGLATLSSELVRLAVVDGERLIFVAKAQGARSGLRYDPQNGQEVDLFCTATGYAWLASLSDEQAVALIARQGLSQLDERGPRVPHNYPDILAYLHAARKQGYSQVVDVSAPGMSAVATVVRKPKSGQVIGVLSVGGPTARLPEATLSSFVPALLAAATELGELSPLSDYLTPLVQY